MRLELNADCLDFNVLEQLFAIKWGHFVTPLDRGCSKELLDHSTLNGAGAEVNVR